MPLKPTSSFGYLDEKNPHLPLTVPASAPLITGKRAIVYVEIPDTDRPTYSLREVVLGPRAGNVYVVYEGLKEGDRVVTSGNFKIDSAMQILAKASMMTPREAHSAGKPQKTEEVAVEQVSAPFAFLEALKPALLAYAGLKESLVEEKADEAAKQASDLLNVLKGVSPEPLDDKGRKTWTELSGTMIDSLSSITDAKEVTVQRKVFDVVSESFARMLMAFRHSAGEAVTVFFCPKVFDGQGAYWVELGRERRNPYFSRSTTDDQHLAECGEVVETITPVESKGEQAGSEGKKPEEG